MQTFPAATETPSLAAATSSQSRRATLAQRGAIVLAATLLVAVCAHVSLPLYFTPVPLTLQTFAVLLVGLALGPRAGFAALGLYLAEGAAGLPVFSPLGVGGPAQLLGPTGGFLLSYPFAAAAAGAVYRRLRAMGSPAIATPFAAAMLAGVPASIIVFAFGATWLAFLTHAGPVAIWTAAVAPFLPGEVIKMAAAAGCVAAWQRSRRS